MTLPTTVSPQIGPQDKKPIGVEVKWLKRKEEERKGAGKARAR
jgi:hypothetical protein